MTDIVERLRAPYYPTQEESDDARVYALDEQRNEAADEIESLRENNEKLREIALRAIPIYKA